ncbi:hypothetical protein [Chryseobacterium sp. MP_3.2]|uniref:hypothetical protein n=1 Tax=Chryseobacterium sp. MP_3.2 TaxID=3071712 RepID=UPI002DFBDC43|nr:hypothetical protein [Chryseobacterium sp. MP_3.2]
MITPTYSPEVLSDLIWKTKNIVDHESLAQLFTDLHEQGDLDFNPGLKREFASPKNYFRFVGKIYNSKELCEFMFTLMELQEKDLATITLVLQRRIEFQRELIIARNNINPKQL